MNYEYSFELIGFFSGEGEGFNYGDSYEDQSKQINKIHAYIYDFSTLA